MDIHHRRTTLCPYNKNIRYRRVTDPGLRTVNNETAVGLSCFRYHANQRIEHQHHDWQFGFTLMDLIHDLAR